MTFYDTEAPHNQAAVSKSQILEVKNLLLSFYGKKNYVSVKDPLCNVFQCVFLIEEIYAFIHHASPAVTL